MAHLSLSQYLQQVDNSWRSKDGNLLSELLSFRHGHVASSKLQLENPETQVERMIDPPLDEIIAAHLRCIWAINSQDYVEGYRCQSLVVQALTKVLQTQREENWALPVMYTVCLDLRLMAAHADRSIASQADKRTETLEKAAKCLMDCFRICASDNRSSEDYTKRWGMLTLVNQLFKVYFSINKLHLCKPLIRAIESSPLKDHFSLSQQVTYKYYVGRKAMFDSNYKMADEYLSFAFKRCHKDSWNNKRLILIYLIPVKMLLGYMPKRALLQKYDLLQFLEIVEAVKQGNLQQFNKMMEVHESFFIQCGIFLILEKLKIISYRNLFKKVYLLMKTHQLPIETLLIALKCMDIPDIDLDETECIVANLIFEGKIKGYISHQHKKLVVSKQNPFPLLNTVM